MEQFSQFEPDDPRVKELQKLAWSLQNLTNKPGNRLPDTFKKECYRVASKALNLCSDVAYLEEKDFLERSKIFTKQLEAKKKEVEEVEGAEKAKLVGKCMRAAPGGNYVVGSIEDRSKAASLADSRSLTSTAGGARTLTVSEVTSRCGEDPEALFLCDLGLGDGDVETLCDGLKRAGASLTSLDVSHNLIADVGVQRLVSALAAGTCPKLRELHIGGNSFGELGAQMLTSGLAALRRNLVVHLDSSDSERRESGTASADRERAAEAREPQAEELASPDADGIAATSSDAGESAPPSCSQTPPLEACVAPSEGNAQELGSSETGESDAALAAMQVDVIRAKDADAVEVRALLSLPDGIASAGDLDVDVSAWRLLIRTASGAPVADAALPCAVVTESAQAVFSRKRRTMTITLQPSDPAAAAAALGA